MNTKSKELYLITIFLVSTGVLSAQSETTTIVLESPVNLQQQTSLQNTPKYKQPKIRVQESSPQKTTPPQEETPVYETPTIPLEGNNPQRNTPTTKNETIYQPAIKLRGINPQNSAPKESNVLDQIEEEYNTFQQSVSKALSVQEAYIQEYEQEVAKLRQKNQELITALDQKDRIIVDKVKTNVRIESRLEAANRERVRLLAEYQKKQEALEQKEVFQKQAETKLNEERAVDILKRMKENREKMKIRYPIILR